MPRDLWLLKRPAIRTEKINQSLTLAAQTFGSGKQNASVLVKGGTISYLQVNSATLELTDNFTFEMWLKVTSTNDANLIEMAPSFGFFLAGFGNVFSNVSIQGTDLAIKTTSAVLIPQGVWFHYAVTFGFSGSGKMKLFIDGIKKAEVTLTAPLFTLNTLLKIGSSTANFNGAIGETRVWDEERTEEEIAYNYRTRRNITGIDLGLKNYWLMNEGSGTIATDTKAGLVLPLLAGNEWSITDYPPLIYGASFIVAKWTVSAAGKFSFQFPVVPPTGTTGQLCVSWTDAAGVFQRRRLWTLAGVDIAPTPALYQGEPLESNASLEMWNVDGEATVVIPSAITLGVSSTTDPTSSYDHTSVAAATITPDTTLAQEFPLTPFPLVFNTQQTY